MTMCKLFYLSKSPPVCGCFLANSLCNWVYVGMNQRFQNRIWTVRIILTLVLIRRARMRNFHFISSKKKFPFSPQIFIGQQQRERGYLERRTMVVVWWMERRTRLSSSLRRRKWPELASRMLFWSGVGEESHLISLIKYSICSLDVSSHRTNNTGRRVFLSVLLRVCSGATMIGS